MAGGARFVLLGDLSEQLLNATAEQREEIGAEIVGIAQGSAPVETGEYRGGMGVETDGQRVFVVDNDPEAAWKEYGTSDTPAHATLTDAARQFGEYSGYQPRGGR